MAGVPFLDRVIQKNEKPKNRFSTEEAVSVVFFSFPIQPRVQLKSIERIGNSLRIHYLLISSGLLDVRPALALIPLGKLKSGDYQVEMVRLPNEATIDNRYFPPIEANFEHKYICRSFSFVVYARGT